MSNHRVFILGAGFSKQAGLPLASELTSLVLERPLLKDYEELQEWLADFKTRLAKLEGGGKDFQLNIEQLFDFAEYDMELYRMWQQFASVGRNSGMTYWSRAEGISTWLSYIQKDIVHVIGDAQKKTDFGSIRRFTERLSADDTVITFNYDTLVEMVLSQNGQTWNHGLNDWKNGGVTILKMHGSIDWILLERREENELEKFTKLFSKKDSNVEEHGSQEPEEAEYKWELWRAKDTKTCNAALDMDKSCLSSFRYFLGLAGLGRYKPLHQLPGSAQTWFNAFQAMHKAHEVYVIGFSMSPYDSMARFHFTSVIRKREKPLEKTVIVNPSAVDLAGNYHAIFGDPITHVSKKAEEVDWESMLA